MPENNQGFTVLKLDIRAEIGKLFLTLKMNLLRKLFLFTTGFLVSGTNSVELASVNFNSFLANSITAHCNPRQIPEIKTILKPHYSHLIQIQASYRQV